MTDSNNSLRLPVSPYLDNSTLWWVDTYAVPVTPNGSAEEHAQMKLEYQQWMRDQGVVVKGTDYMYTADDPCLEFTDERSMLLFILRWGN